MKHPYRFLINIAATICFAIVAYDIVTDQPLDWITRACAAGACIIECLDGIKLIAKALAHED